MTTTPSLAEFLATARREFAFLPKHLGFIEIEPGPNPYAVRYAKANVVVRIEGVNWGCVANVLVTLDGVTLPLWAIAKAGGFCAAPAGDQLEQLSSLAQQLLKATELLDGDSSCMAAAQDIFQESASQLRAEERRAEEMEADRRAIALSEDAFRVGEWAKVVAALAPREARLSRATAARLQFARRKLRGEA